MVALAKLVLGTVVAVPALWSGGWFYGKSEIQSQLDARIVEWRAQGVEVSYESLEVEGYPFAYRGQVVAPKSQGLLMTSEGPVRADWRAPWVAFDASLGDFGAVNFELPDLLNARVTPLNGGSTTDVAVRSKALKGRLEQADGLLKLNAGGDAVEVEVTPASEDSVVVQVERITARASAPDGAGRVAARVDLEGATANGNAWSLFDPAGRFPRDPAKLSLEGSADLAVFPDASVGLQTLRIEQVALDVAGVSMDGEGEADVLNRRPDGAMTLRFSGLGGFIENAAGAGFFPEKQAALYRVMVDSFASKGTREGEQVFEIAFKSGYVFVNGRPTFIPAPVLP